jgi:hypothetical protein
MYGSAADFIRPGIQTFPAIASLATVNGCVDTTGAYYTQPACAAFYDGIVTHGLQATLKQFLFVARQLAAARLPAVQGAEACVPLSLDTPDFAFLYACRWQYLAAGFFDLSDIHEADAAGAFGTFNSVNLAICVSAILALPIIYFLVFLPLIRMLDTEIKNTRSLLLLLPDDVSRSVPAIIALGDAMAKDASAAVSGA